MPDRRETATGVSQSRLPEGHTTLGAALRTLFQRGRNRNQSTQGEAAPPTPEERLEPVAEELQNLDAAGEEHLEGERGVIAANRAAAQAESTEMKKGQAAAAAGFDASDTAAETGLTDIQANIQKTKDEIATLPAEVQGEFDRQQTVLDAGMDEARTGMAGHRTEALAGVMEGRANAMDAAVDSIHGATRQQISEIDAQVQQGLLSPSQAQAMKANINMGSAMQLSAAVGQTAHMFTQTQAQVATSFGQQFAAFEGQAAQVQGQFGAQAAGAFGQAQTALAGFNTELTRLDAQATGQRDAILSTNAAARSAFQNANDVNNMAMLDYTQDTYVSPYPMALNMLTATRDLAGDYMRSDQFQQSVGLMIQNMNETQRNNLLQLGMTGLQLLLG